MERRPTVFGDERALLGVARAKGEYFILNCLTLRATYEGYCIEPQ
jgi:hypothetical protein